MFLMCSYFAHLWQAHVPSHLPLQPAQHLSLQQLLLPQQPEPQHLKRQTSLSTPAIPTRMYTTASTIGHCPTSMVTRFQSAGASRSMLRPTRPQLSAPTTTRTHTIFFRTEYDVPVHIQKNGRRNNKQFIVKYRLLKTASVSNARVWCSNEW